MFWSALMLLQMLCAGIDSIYLWPCTREAGIDNRNRLQLFEICLAFLILKKNKNKNKHFCTRASLCYNHVLVTQQQDSNRQYQTAITLQLLVLNPVNTAAPLHLVLSHWQMIVVRKTNKSSYDFDPRSVWWVFFIVAESSGLLALYHHSSSATHTEWSSAAEVYVVVSSGM